jgi:hypothetical protein
MSYIFGIITFYFSDDLNVYDGTNQSGIAWGSGTGDEEEESTPTSYGSGDIAGVGLTLAGDLYFTLNGQRVGRSSRLRPLLALYPAYTDDQLRDEAENGGAVIPIAGRRWCLFPAISGSGEWRVALNFGQRRFRYEKVYNL